MSLEIRVDVDDILAELDRLADAPNERTIFELNSVLALTFEATQAFVHVQTGSLKGSGKQHSEVKGDVWIGEVTYGGTSTGPIPLVEYAVIEQERRPDRRGNHDFLTPSLHMSGLFDAVVHSALRGER